MAVDMMCSSGVRIRRPVARGVNHVLSFSRLIPLSERITRISMSSSMTISDAHLCFANTPACGFPGHEPLAIILKEQYARLQITNIGRAAPYPLRHIGNVIYKLTDLFKLNATSYICFCLLISSRNLEHQSVC